MPYRIDCLCVKNFKCFDDKKYYRFTFDENLNPTILSGPNGFGKTTFFDAIELIFTKDITRLYEKIEDGRINLGKNILLNKAERDGVLVLSLKDHNNKLLTIVTLINHKNEKLSIENSIKYSVLEGILHSDEDIDLFVQSQLDWKTSLSECKDLRYSIDHFNVYYYVSQAESVHFLKKSVNDRKSSVNALLNTAEIDENISFIEKELIGANKGKKGVLVNDAIRENKDIIEKKVRIIKDKSGKIDFDTASIVYEQLIDYAENLSPFPWDLKDINFGTNNSKVNLEEMIKEIQSLHCFMINKGDYEVFLKNEMVKKIIANKTGIDDFIKYLSFIEEKEINKAAINKIIKDNRQKINIYNHSNFFRKGMDVSAFKKEDLIQIKELDDSLLLTDIADISNKIDTITKIKKELSDNQKLLNELDNARQELHKYTNTIDDTGICPFCAHQFENTDALELAFSGLSSAIAKRKNGDSEKTDELIKELKSILDKDYQKILQYVQGLDDQIIRSLNLSATQDQQFVDNPGRIKTVESIAAYIQNNSFLDQLNDSEKPLAIERFLQEQIITYTNPDFENDSRKYNFSVLVDKYKKILTLKQNKIVQKELVDRKINYLKYKHSLGESKEITQLRAELKEEIIKKHKLDILQNKLYDLKTLYKDSIDSYKNQVIKKLRIPLLVYSGKILQDYQNGLGVFISKDEMRFVANGDAKHDVLNTFSSGQLSGFVLSFLFAMNKQYVTKSSDELGFILVDDPVQTMDDINVASLIEVMRNDFSDKQIILSTHESDKENYILYKFLKYNLKGQSFNVKEKLYL